MTSDPNGWPDPARPGVPLHPEKDGWHWLQNRKPNCAPYPVQWKADGGWVWNAVAYQPAQDTSFRYRYLGPCLTPAEVTAREAAAAAEMREASDATVERAALAIAAAYNPDLPQSTGHGFHMMRDHSQEQFRTAARAVLASLQIPAPGALDRARCVASSKARKGAQ